MYGKSSCSIPPPYGFSNAFIINSPDLILTQINKPRCNRIKDLPAAKMVPAHYYQLNPVRQPREEVTSRWNLLMSLIIKRRLSLSGKCTKRKVIALMIPNKPFSSNWLILATRRLHIFAPNGSTIKKKKGLNTTITIGLKADKIKKITWFKKSISSKYGE